MVDWKSLICGHHDDDLNKERKSGENNSLLISLLTILVWTSCHQSRADLPEVSIVSAGWFIELLTGSRTHFQKMFLLCLKKHLSDRFKSLVGFMTMLVIQQICYWLEEYNFLSIVDFFPLTLSKKKRGDTTVIWSSYLTPAKKAKMSIYKL